MIHNPVLPGFHPDPSILRVGQDYYLATSTFEWWPGVRIHHSRDLVHWRHCTYPLTRNTQFDLRGNPDSCGIWAPCLSYAHGQFWLLYTNVRTLAGAYKDTPNYLITAPTIEGPWSDPVYLNSSGFDPSLFHDDDGRSYVVNMEWSHRAGRTPFSGILLQEYSRAEQKLVGPIHRISAGSPIGLSEGPHLYKRKGLYYLMLAEGGTGYEHAVSLLRAPAITGPYDVSPYHPLISAHHTAGEGLQKAGHGSLVETEQGECYVAHLCARPIEQDTPRAAEEYDGLHCVLGRETALQKVEWTADGWLRSAQGSSAPAWQVAAPALPAHPWPKEPTPTRFAPDAPLSPHFNSLRVPMDEHWVSQRARPGYLRIHGRESLMSFHDQSLIMRRQQAFDCVAETELDFAPDSFQQMAGLLAYYNTQNHTYLCVSHDEALGRVLLLLGNDNGIYREWAGPVAIPAHGAIRLQARFARRSLQFAWATADGDWQAFGPALPTALLSDEHATRFEGGYARSFGFTGNYVGMACQDLTGRRQPADFAWFDYRETAC